MFYHNNKYRKSIILELLDKHRYLQTKMIVEHLNISNSRCGDLLLAMVKSNDLKRFRIAPRTQYIYHTERKSQKWRHWLAINEFHFYLTKFAHIIDYRLEYHYKYGIADGLYLAKFKKSGLKFFLEVDDGNNTWDKYEKYQNYFISKYWVEEFWADPKNTGIPDFPLLLIITPRKKELEKKLRIIEVNYLVFLANDYRDAVRKLVRYSNED